jgi:ABC-type lipoprotein release transport system permease subunit
MRSGIYKRKVIMTIFFLIGWRNIWRHKRRSLVVIFSIALGIFALIAGEGFINGLNTQMVENNIKTSLGHMAIHQKGFHENMTLSRHFNPNEKIIQAIQNEKEILAFAPRIKVQGMVRSSDASRGVMIVGIDPEKEKKVSGLFEFTLQDNGSAFLSRDDRDVVLISKSLADKLGLVIGDKLVLMFQDKHNEIVGIGMRIKGFFVTPVETFDKYVVFVPLGQFRETTGLDANLSELSLLVKESRSIETVKERLTAAVNDPDLEILSWKDMAPYLLSSIKVFDSIMYISFMIIFITVIFSVANTLVMAIMERFHEIGVMKAIGTKPSVIFLLILFETIILGVIGLIAGVIAGIGFTELIAIKGIDLSFYVESMRTWGTGSIIYPTVKVIDIIAAIIIVSVTTVVSALYPALKAARIKPLEALNYL